MYDNVMVDLETWSVKPNAQIISIGAVAFNMNGDVTKDNPKFHMGVAPDELSMRALFHVDPQTLLWWMSPERDAAREAWLKLEKGDISSVLEGFSLWWAETFGPDPMNGAQGSKPKVWGNGATFDNVILRHAFEATGLEPPWTYRDDACHRTMRGLLQQPPAPAEADIVAILPEGGRVAHAALYDACWQARQLQLIHQEIFAT